MLNSLKNNLSSLSNLHKVGLGATLIAFYVGILTLAVMSSNPTFEVLYSKLSQGDASAIKIKLQERKIRFRLISDRKGETIEIPANQVAEIRLDLANQNLPKQHVDFGNEIFDNVNGCMTEAVQKINRQRATEDELSRTIKCLTGIKDSRVHIAMPVKRVDSKPAEDGKASVIVHMLKGYKLSAKQIISIKYIVASSVERLTPKKVIILDSKGNILNTPRKDTSLAY
jgi:flagellar M-ring protein FliF